MTNLLIIFFARYVGWILGILAVVFIFWSREHSQILKNLRIAFESFFAALISRFVFTEFIRYFYDRPRPFEVENIAPLISHDAGGSFPSGHAAFLFALATTVFIYDRRWGVVFFAGAILVGLGRVWAGVHWPSDIFAGAVVGILTSVLVNFLAKKFRDSNQ